MDRKTLENAFRPKLYGKSFFLKFLEIFMKSYIKEGKLRNKQFPAKFRENIMFEYFRDIVVNFCDILGGFLDCQCN